MNKLTQELIASLPTIRFDKSWRVKMLPVQFPHEGELFRFRIYKQAECLSVIGWEGYFEFYTLDAGGEVSLSYDANKRRPELFRETVNGMLAASKHNSRTRKLMLANIKLMGWPDSWLLEDCRACKNGDILAEVKNGELGVCLKFRLLIGRWEVYTQQPSVAGFDYDDYSGVTEFMHRWL